MLRIDALAKLGRASEARQHAQTFVRLIRTACSRLACALISTEARCEGIRPSASAALLVPAFAVALCACTSTTDSLGYNGPRPVADNISPASDPNVSLLLSRRRRRSTPRSPRLERAVLRRQHAGDLLPPGDRSGRVRHTFHGDIRTEGFGYAMMIAVQLDKRTEFDRMWTYVKSVLSYP